MIKPTDKIPLGSFMEDMEEMHKKTIDPVTGRLFLKHSLQDAKTVKEARQKEILEERFKDVEKEDEADLDLEEKVRNIVIREMSLDNEHIVPTVK
jgi:hypothetical protein